MKLIRLLLIIALVIPHGLFAGPKKDEDPTTYHDIPLTSASVTPKKIEEGSTENTALLSGSVGLVDWDTEDNLYDCDECSTYQKVVCCTSTLTMTICIAIGLFIIFPLMTSH